MSTYYELLGVPKDADEEQIGLRYRELALKYHPDKAKDKGVAKEIFLRLAKAYEVLIHPG
ncbi:MAG: DnaJ domain-containing protein, partial [Abditibacteriota bacterium]|nr:DnaJ domain-containing protein [Abditibacteriota bacterium]